MSLSSVKAKRALARRARALPRLREAVDARQLGYEAARLVASVASPETADAWVERLRGLDSSRLVLIQVAGNKGLRIEFYCRNRTEAQSLVARFGGTVRPLPSESWKSGAAASPSRPLPFGSSLVVTGHDEELPALRAKYPQRVVLCIPAALAFGSGEHATTSMCLRMLVAGASRRAGAKWEMLDLGTGSGVLAIAARALGARSAQGFDYDPPCVRTARENARRNFLTRVTFAVADAFAWQPARRWDVITANLYSELLVAALPLWKTRMRKNSRMILSGVLRDQESELLRVLRANRFEITKVRRRGKWIALICHPERSRAISW
jgi:ribosomal protein L11 methyltransferase